jgi:hypothetical protein
MSRRLTPAEARQMVGLRKKFIPRPGEPRRTDIPRCICGKHPMTYEEDLDKRSTGAGRRDRNVGWRTAGSSPQ